MAIIFDPTDLNDGTEITVTPGTKKIKLQVSGNLTTDGVTLKCVYSKLKELWKDSATYIAYPFPMQPITDEQFEMINGWDWDKTVSITGSGATVNLIRTGGWALKDTNGVSQEEWAGIVTLGSLAFADGNGRVYYQQAATGYGSSATNVILQNTAGVNQAVQVYQSGVGTYITASADLRGYFKAFSREYGKTYAASSLTDIGVDTMTYQVYRFPLTNGTDLKIGVPDASMSSSPYSLMSITYHTGSQTRTGLVGSGGSGSFHVIIDAGTASGSTQQVYEFVQYKLRQNSDIDAGTELPSVIGKTAAALLQFVGDTLYTLRPSAGSGTFVDNISNTNINDIFFVDDGGTNRYYPYAANVTFQFGDNLVADAGAIYHVYFTTNGSGGDFGTAGAITVQDKNLAFMSGNIDGSSSITKTYDYDANVQRGATSSGTDAPITVVAIGLDTAQYVKAVGTIARSKANTVSLVAPLERNYNNP
jgi:hypothetical protein